MLMGVLLCCICVACCTVMLRLKCGLRRRVDNDEDDRRMARHDADVDAESRNREGRVE